MAPPMVQLYHNRNVNKNSLLFKVDYTSLENLLILSKLLNISIENILVIDEDINILRSINTQWMLNRINDVLVLQNGIRNYRIR